MSSAGIAVGRRPGIGKGCAPMLTFLALLGGARSEEIPRLAVAGPEETVVSAETMTLAVSWTLLALMIVLLAIVFFIVRYVRVTRERYWAAIDQAEMDAKVQPQDGTARPMAEVTAR